MAKLNLGALNKTNINNTSEINNSESKVEVINIEIETPSIPKKKFSFKELNISGSKKEDEVKNSEESIIIEPIISEIKENIINNDVEVKNEENSEKPKIGIKSLIKEIDLNEEILETTVEKKNINAEIKVINPEEILGENIQIIEEIKSEEIKNEIINTQSNDETKKVISISDGDTNCAIMTTEETEIFGSYKGSFTKNDETKKEIKNLPIINNIPLIKGELNGDSKIKTPLESYSENNTVNKKNKSKKIIFTSIFTIASLSLSGFLIFESGLLKSNIQEINNTANTNIETSKDNKNKQEEIVVEETKINEEILEIPVDNNNITTGEVEIVKENLEIPVDNNINSSKINKKVEDFLIKKYKNK